MHPVGNHRRAIQLFSRATCDFCGTLTLSACTNRGSGILPLMSQSSIAFAMAAEESGWALPWAEPSAKPLIAIG